MPRFYIAKTLMVASLTLTAQMAIGQTTTPEQPACKELEELYVELGKRSGQIPTPQEINAAIYDENPTNDECQMMLSLFPPLE